jgi:hypothetical protein
MTTIATSKSHGLNWLEGFTLTALFQALPTFATAVLLLKLAGSRAIVGDPNGAVAFVVLASAMYALLTPYLGPKYPKVFRNGYEPLFFDATLPFAEKILRWREQPTTSLQLITAVLLLSLLAVGVANLR